MACRFDGPSGFERTDELPEVVQPVGRPLYDASVSNDLLALDSMHRTAGAGRRAVLAAEGRSTRP